MARLLTFVPGDALKRTPLHVAASEGQLEAVRLLLTLKADPNAKDIFDNTPLNDAVRGAHDRVAELIRMWGRAEETCQDTLSKPAEKAGKNKPSDTPMDKNATKGMEAACTGADLSEHSANESEDIVFRLELAGRQAGVHLCEAAAKGDLKAVSKLLPLVRLSFQQLWNDHVYAHPDRYRRTNAHIQTTKY